MQPFSVSLDLPLLTEPLVIGERRYTFRIEDGKGIVEAQSSGGTTRYTVQHVMGGKNVYFLLTPQAKGRLQVLPIAYDVREQVWYDTTGSMVRHALGNADGPVDWEDSLLTFNTSCWGCHVSQLSVNYDLETDTYDSRWAEPGINCEACHGSCIEHVRICQAAAAAGEETPADLKVTMLSTFTHREINDGCATCHAKAIVVSDTFQPRDRYFDHFDLACLEDPDFYPDGRDLGENYTFTLWRMSPCAKSGQLDCVDCHTSSGRYRFAADTNQACMPCHADHVNDAPAHTHHDAGSDGNHCVSCHMPMTTFARMRRSDHSMRPPAPALTETFGSPNACNICHEDKDAARADAKVRAWRERDYQKPMMARASLVLEAREQDWTHLEAMLEEIRGEGRDEITATSLIRLLTRCPDLRIAPVFVGALGDASPLVRATAAAALEPFVRFPQVVGPLFAALGDDVRLVRIRAAGALAGVPVGDLPEKERATLEGALDELEKAWRSRPDQWHAHYNLGNLLEQRGEVDGALAAYATATRLRPDAVEPRVNAAMIHARAGDLKAAEKALRAALEVDAESAEAHYNLGLLLVETKQRDEAKQHLERAFELDGTLARAALNRAVIAAQEEDAEAAILWSRKAAQSAPLDPRVAWTHAYYLVEAKRPADAVEVLRRALDAGAVSPEVYDLLGRTLAQMGDTEAAQRVWKLAAQDERLPAQARQAFAMRARGR